MADLFTGATDILNGGLSCNNRMQAKRLKCFPTSEDCNSATQGILNGREFLLRLCDYRIQASASKTRCKRISQDALHQQYMSSKYEHAIESGCVPVVDALSTLVLDLHEEHVEAFSLLFFGIEELTKNGSKILTMFHSLSAKRDEMLQERRDLSCRTSRIAEALRASEDECTQLSNLIGTLSREEVRATRGCEYVNLTASSIHELRTQHCADNLRLEFENSISKSRIDIVVKNLDSFRDKENLRIRSVAQASTEKKYAASCEKKKRATLVHRIEAAQVAQLQTSTTIEKRNTSSTILKAQHEGQMFCIEMLMSKTNASEEAIDAARKKLNKLRDELAAYSTLQDCRELLPQVLARAKSLNDLDTGFTRQIADGKARVASAQQECDSLIYNISDIQQSNDSCHKKLELVCETLGRLVNTKDHSFCSVPLMRCQQELQRRITQLASLRRAKLDNLSKIDAIESGRDASREVCIAARAAASQIQNMIDQAAGSKDRDIDFTELLCTVQHCREELEMEREGNRRLKLHMQTISSELEALKSGIADSREELRSHWNMKNAEAFCPHSKIRASITEEELARCNTMFLEETKAVREERLGRLRVLEDKLQEYRKMSLQRSEHNDRQLQGLNDTSVQNNGYTCEGMVLAAIRSASVKKTDQYIETKPTSTSDGARATHTDYRFLMPSHACGTMQPSPHLRALREKLANNRDGRAPFNKDAVKQVAITHMQKDRMLPETQALHNYKSAVFHGSQSQVKHIGFDIFSA